MRSIAVCVLLLVVACALGQAASINNQSLARQRRETGNTGIDLFANTRKLIEDLIANLRKAAQQAADAMAIFASGLQDQVKLMREKLEADLQKLRNRVSEAISNIGDRFSNAGAAVKECVESHKKKADVLFNDAIYRTMTCADGKVQEVSDLISRQVEISQGGLEFANKAMEEMKNCTENNNNVFSKGACLGVVALKTEMKGAVFLTQSGISIARIDIALASLPVSLEMCAGRRLVEAGMGTAKIIMDLGRCSAVNAVSTIAGSEAADTNASVVDSAPAEVTETVPVVDSAPAEVTETAPVVDSAPADTETVPVVDSAPAEVTETVPVVDSAPADTETVPVVDSAPAEVTETVPVVDSALAEVTETVAE